MQQTMKAAVVLCLLGCFSCNNRAVTFQRVPVEGLPYCDQSHELNGLKRPLLLEIKHRGGDLRQQINGTDRQPTVSLAAREERVIVRVGQCEGLARIANSAAVTSVCNRPSWIGEPQEMTIDPRQPGAKLVVQVDGEHACWHKQTASDSLPALIQSKKYGGALSLLKDRLKEDPSSSNHLELARLLVRLRQEDKVCQFDAYRSTVLDHLEAAVRLEPGLTDKLVKDDLFKEVAQTVRFQLLAGLSLERVADVKVILTHLQWGAFLRGARGHLGSLEFRPNNQLVLRQGTDPDDKRSKPATFTGTYSITGREVQLKLAKPLEGKTVFRGVLDSTGKINFAEPLGVVSDSDPECSV